MLMMPLNGWEYLQMLKKQQTSIKSLEDEAKEYQASTLFISSPSMEEIHGGVPVDISAKLARVFEYGQMIYDKYDELMAIKKQARRLVEMIPEEDAKTVIWEYYGRNHSYNKIIGLLHMSKSSVWRRMHDGETAFNAIFFNEREQILSELQKICGDNKT